MNSDAEIKDAFRQLRQADLESQPNYRGMTSGMFVSARSTQVVNLLRIGLAFTAVAVLFFVRTPDRRALAAETKRVIPQLNETEVVLASSWDAPSDFLLTDIAPSLDAFGDLDFKPANKQKPLKP
ncbi:MAG: hypothetical protein CMO80_20475 [Verrucomicrobiales bacterium]|nr:hypothetical protein [Verrucomicrobiales bacterium]|tara:strand:- start:675 stop:1049 length:375 start_codon:yes stop_codon:yes gene_type:complete